MQESFLTSEQVATMLQVHPFTVLKLIRSGRLSAMKIGRVYRIKESDLNKFVDNSTQVKPAKPGKESTKERKPTGEPNQVHQVKILTESDKDSNRDHFVIE